MKKILLLLALMLLMGAQTAVNAQYVTIDGLNYHLYPDTYGAVLHNGKSWQGELSIPSVVNYEGQDYTVTEIDSYSFFSNITITSVTIPGSVTSIGEGAFSDCFSLTSVIISEGVKTIDSQAFCGCSNLSDIYIPNSVTQIDRNTFDGTAWYYNQPNGLVYAGMIAYKYKGDAPEGTQITIKDGTHAITSRAFCDCKGLTSVTIPESVESIGPDAFQNCSDLVSVNIPERVSCIEERCFFDCSSLKSIVIPESVKRIGIAAFKNCTSLSSANIPEGISEIEEHTFFHCSNLTAINIPKNVTRIKDEAFSNTSLKTITIPKNVKSIGASAFEGCSKLTDVYCLSRTTPQSRGDIFNGASIASATLHVPESSIEYYKASSPWSGFGYFVALEPASIEINEENFPDENFRNWLLEQEYGADGVLSDAEIVDVQKIIVNELNIQSLKGIEFFTELRQLECKNNQLISLDVFEKTELVKLQCDNNQLTSLNVMGCSSLSKLTCSNNQLTSLEMKGCKYDFLNELDCSNNQLTELDLSNCRSLSKFKCYQNKIRGVAMDVLVESLCIGGSMYVIFNENEQNVMTTRQVEAALAKNWVPYYTYNGRSWRRYEGSEEPITYTKDQMATIILPTEPDASKGKYYRLDRSEDNQIIFEQELQPQARVPYIIVPSEDFSIDPNALNLEGLHSDTVSIEGVSFIGSYVREELPALTGEDGVESSYIDFIDTTPDCGPSISEETGKESLLIGTLRAYLIVKWDDPIDHGSPSVPPFGKKEIVLHDYSTGINSLTPDPSPRRGEVFDLQGRRLSGKPAKGVYINDGKKYIAR